MDIITAFVNGISRFVSLPVAVLTALLSNYMFVIFFGGLIFFLANTPPEALTRIFDAFQTGDFAAVIDAVVDATILFAGNVQHNFNPENLAASLNSAVCKIMNFTGLGECTQA